MRLITARRQERGWSRSELARQAGMHASTVGQIENGRYHPYPVQLEKLANALGIPVDQASTLLEEVSADARAAA